MNVKPGDIVERIDPVGVVECVDEASVKIDGAWLLRDDADKLYAPTGDRIDDPTSEAVV